MPQNKTPTGLTAPTVHLNGSSGSALEEALDKAARDCQTALNSVMECYPHGRDYYPQGEGAYDAARKEHQARMAAISKVMGELMEISRNVHRQGRR